MNLLHWTNRVRQFFNVPVYKYCARTCSARFSSTSIPQTDTVVKNNVLYGQPTAASHPHILAPGEVVIGVGLEEIQQRRINLLQLVQKHATNHVEHSIKNHLIIIPSSTKKYMSDKIPYVFRQNSDFYYLSGCLEPDTVLILEINEENKCKSTLFMRPKDRHAELWDGPRTGIESAPGFFGVDEAVNITEVSRYIERYLSGMKSKLVWYDETISDLDNVSKNIASICPHKTKSPTSLIHKLRVIKSPAEQELMRQTCKIASKAINRVIRESRPGISEHEVFAKVDFYCRMDGASFLAYPPVVAGGRNATTIHYVNNSQIVNNGDMILMDAGCEYGGYSSDITRTWPVNGHFSDAQKVLYEILSTVQEELLESLQNEGGENLDQLFDTMCVKLGRYLKEIGLIDKRVNGIDMARAAYKFCPHHVSHYLGMDVHDTPMISRNISLEPGMICTVEPGIYIQSDRRDVPPEFRGLGLRIEDDVLILPDKKIEVLTDSCMKNLLEIEKSIIS